MNNAKTFTDKLQQGRICLGTGISLADPVVSEALASDLDFFWIDMGGRQRCARERQLLLLLGVRI